MKVLPRRLMTRFEALLFAAIPILVSLPILATVTYPRVQRARAVHAQAQELQQEALVMRAEVAGTVDTTNVEVDAVKVFELRVPTDDPVPQLLEHLAGQANEGAEAETLRNLRINADDPVGPPLTPPEQVVQIAGTFGFADPRLELFPSELSYTALTIYFDCSYARLGRFLWELRWMPSLIEVHSLEIQPGPNPSLVRVKLVIAALRRVPGEKKATREVASQSATSTLDIAPKVDLALNPIWPRNPFARRQDAEPAKSRDARAEQ